jgi:trehalose-phosphatase
MRNLLENWNVVRPRLRAAQAIALFLDFDGTLSPLQARPEEVELPPAARRALCRLSRRRHMNIWVISGRRQADVCARISIAGVRCLGLYGWENGALPKVDGPTRRMLTEARSELAQEVGRAGGLWIEDKDVTFALHYRGASANDIQRGRAIVERMRGAFGRWLNFAPGDHVWEVMPRRLRGKGQAVRRYLHRMSRYALPVYIGDDAADEPAFAALSRGITARVGPARPTYANFRLRNPAEVCRILERLDQDAR